MYNFPKETPLFHTNMGQTTCGRIKNNLDQQTIFAIGTKYLCAENKLLHFGDRSRFNHKDHLALLNFYGGHSLLNAISLIEECSMLLSCMTSRQNKTQNWYAQI